MAAGAKDQGAGSGDILQGMARCGACVLWRPVSCNSSSMLLLREGVVVGGGGARARCREDRLFFVGVCRS